MGRDITTFVIRVDGEVKAHQLIEFVILRETKQLGQVVTIILILVNGRKLAILVNVAVDTTSNVGELGNQIHGILKGRVPVIFLVNTLVVGLGELRFMLKSVDSQRELRHGMKSLGASVNDFLHKLGNVRASSPLSRELLDLLLSGDFTSEQEPEERFGQGFLTTISSGQFLLALGDGLATETNTFISIKDRSFPDKTLDTTHTTVSHVNGDFTENIVTMLGLESLDLLLLLRNKFGEALLQRL